MQHFVETDDQTGERYLFIFNSNQNVDTIRLIPQGMALLDDSKEREVPPTHGQELGIEYFAELPYVVFKVIEGHPNEE